MNTPPAQPASDAGPDLSGRILRARVSKIGRDHCDLVLIDPDTGHEYPIHGRLYQHDSLAWREAGLLGDLPAYQAKALLPAVYVTHLRRDGEKPIWFVHERWGLANPWESLDLDDGDLIYGQVSRPIESKKTRELAGYIVQLKVGAPFRDADGDLDVTLGLQPDIEVFIPVDELPYADGHLDHDGTSGGARVKLEQGDPVQAVIIDARLRPPDNPVASLTRLIHARDARTPEIQSRRETGARFRFRKLAHLPDTADDDAETPLAAPLLGRRLLLVDDDPRTLDAYATLYRLNGAEVDTVVVALNKFSQGYEAVAKKLVADPWDLVMVDMNLPGKGLGERLVELVNRRLDPAMPNPPRFLLLTANPRDAQTDPASQERLRRQHVVGLLHRPLQPDTLHRLLAGESVWEAPVTVEPSLPVAAPDSALSLPLGQSVEALLADIAQEPSVRFALLLRVAPDLADSELMSAGQSPFELAELKSVLAETELHLLASGKTGLLNLPADEGGNRALRAGEGAPARWEAFAVEGERWILGVGYKSDWSPNALWPWWRDALAARLANRAWLAWAHQASSFIELGMAHEGLCHEVFNLRNEMHGLLQAGQAWLQKPGGGDVFLPKLLSDIQRVHLDTLSLAEHLLEGLTQRERHVHLPSALSTIRGIVQAECDAHNLALDIGPAPPIALPIPSAALVLPLVNLLLNAAKHHYRLENRRVSLVLDLATDQGRQRLIADVRDNGPGLSRAARARLWQPGHSFALTPEQRHGMGLWLSRRLAEESGGRLECVEDWRWLGSHFRLSFPIEF